MGIPAFTVVYSARARKIMNMAYAVPSLRSDSPSIRVPSDGGAPSAFSNDTTATGSVADNMAPIMSAVSIFFMLE